MDEDIKIKKLKQTQQSAADTNNLFEIQNHVAVPVWIILLAAFIVLATNVENGWHYWWLIFLFKPIFFIKGLKSWSKC